MIVDLIILAAIVLLWIIGGQTKGWIRDGFVPPLLALGCVLGYGLSLFLSVGLFLTISATAQAIRMGYGNYDPEHDDKPSFLASLTHDRGGWRIRGIWGLMVGLAIALPYALITGHYFLPAAYVILNAVVNFCGSRLRLWVFVMDAAVSLAACSIIFIKYIR